MSSKSADQRARLRNRAEQRVTTFHDAAEQSRRRTDVSPQRFNIAEMEKFEAGKV